MLLLPHAFRIYSHLRNWLLPPEHNDKQDLPEQAINHLSHSCFTILGMEQGVRVARNLCFKDLEWIPQSFLSLHIRRSLSEPLR